MLLERAAALTADLKDHLALKAASQQSAVFRTRAQQLSPLASALSEARTDADALRKAGLSVAPADPKPGLCARANELLEQFRADRTSFDAADETFRFEFRPAIENAIAELKDATATAWSEFMAARGGFPADNVLNALEAIPAYAPQVQRIRQAAEAHRRLGERPPRAVDLAAAMAQVQAAARIKDDALSALKSDDVPEEVLTFLRKTGQSGAALVDFTETVRTWLATRGLTGAFRIVSARTA
jgi:hypothetical protein